MRMADPRNCAGLKASQSSDHSNDTDENLARARAVAGAVVDPELPFLTIADLGILRDVSAEGEVVTVSVSPTYSGCPAAQVIEQDISAALEAAGFQVRIERSLSPPWTTDWITDAGLKKLSENGIAPPVRGSDVKPGLFTTPSVTCPFCEARDAVRVSEFGSTACKAQYRCQSCLEPFDYFKCV